MEKGLYMGTNVIEFHRRFQSDEDCYEYLSDLKRGQAYVCNKCGGDRYCKGKKPFSRRCIKCSYDESPTAHTGFKKCKFSLLVAFHIVFKISTKKKGMSSIELSNEFSLRQKTCWAFKHKIQTAMRSSPNHPLTGTVHIDEFLIGEYEQGVVGRSHNSKKRLVIVALEIVERGVGRAYAQVIERASAKEFKPFFNTYISKEAQVITDEWKGYLPLIKEYKKLEQKPSNKGANFKELHIHIMNIQVWLRGIHHHCDKENLQGYLDEYHFRYNRRSIMGSIFNLTLQKLILHNVRQTITANYGCDLSAYTKSKIYGRKAKSLVKYGLMLYDFQISWSNYVKIKKVSTLQC